MMVRQETDIAARFAGLRVAVVGDLVADRYLRGTIDRVSREAPVLIVKHDQTETFPGGAANAAANIASLGGASLAVGIVGKDASGEELTAELAALGAETRSILASSRYSTTTKTRVLAGRSTSSRQQVLRIDHENRHGLGKDDRENLRRLAVSAAAESDAIIISDYGYGAVDVDLFAELLSVARERDVPIVVDSRYRLAEFRGATAATPNLEEAEAIIGCCFEPEAAEEIRRLLECRALLITRGGNGMLLSEERQPVTQIPVVGSAEPVDVTGAGDTVIAVFTMALAAGLDFHRAAEIANHAGGIVVMKRGTATVSLEELSESLASAAPRVSAAADEAL
ncbi:MAG: sugar kinase [Acidobacteria bacterium]|nr:sugar kinase [Acidobacteriota bacterium]